jgi:hypothetical protein
VAQNLLSPAVMFFALGVAAGWVKSDLDIPPSIGRMLGIYLMMSIGFKGGVAIATTRDFSMTMAGVIGAGVGAGLVLPFIGYALLRATTKLDHLTAAAVAALYGSISVVTFATASAFLKTNSAPYAGYIVAILALMEGPAIFSGLFLARRGSVEAAHVPGKEKHGGHSAFANGAIMLLFGAFAIGWVTGQPGMDKVQGFLEVPYQGILCLFLLDMGLLVAQNLSHLKQFTWSLGAFGVYMPLIGAAVGLGVSRMFGLNVGTGTLFTVLCASASYIAVPAAMRLALPEAKPSIYVPMSLSITFPFNIALGIPLYYAAASALLVK